MGFEEKAKDCEEKTGLLAEDMRCAFQNIIKTRLKGLKNEKAILNFKEMSFDSWLLFSSSVDLWDNFISIGKILKTKLELEIAVDIIEFSKPVEEELIILSDDMMKYFKSDGRKLIAFIDQYKGWYREEHKNSPKNSFILLTVKAYDEFEFKSISSKPYSSAEYYLVEHKEFKKLIAVSQKPSVTLRTFLLDNDYISIPAGTYISYDIVILSRNTFLHGDFRAFGGKKNSIWVRIFHEKNNQYYNSGLVTDGHIRIPLSAGKYIIIFSNEYDKGMGDNEDMSYDKTVAATIYLENEIFKAPQVSTILPPVSTRSLIVFEKWLKNPDEKSWGNNVELWIVRSDGSELRQLTKGFHDTGPEWSPNGLSIAFSRIGKDTEGIFLVNSNGNNVQRLSSNIRAYYPQWLQEDLVLFTTLRGSENDWRLFTVSLKDKSEKLIDVGLPGVFRPKVSQNRQLIAFTINEEGSVYISNTNGKNVMKLKSPLGGAIKGYPVIWYPDNKYILIQSIKGDCFKTGLDGIIEPITGIHECNMSWSPDGRTIVYQFNNEIWLMDADCQNKHILTKPSDESHYRNPVWSSQK